MKLQKIFLIILISIVFMPICFGQISSKTEPIDAVKYFDENKRWYNNFTEHWFFFNDISENEVRDSIIQWEEIGKDLVNSNNHWAGTYGDGGETHGDYLRWSEKSGFVWLKVNKCQGGPMQIIRGKVFADTTQIRLIPEHTLGEMGSHGHHNKKQQSEFLFVKWNGVPFLIPKEAIEGFADYTAGLGDFNGLLFLGNPFLSKLGSQDNEEVQELPIFPKGFEKFVKKPVKAQITSFGEAFRRPNTNNDDWEDLIIPIKLNVGKADGVKPDLKLFYVNQEQHFTETVVVKKVEDKFSTAEVIRSVRKKNCAITEYNDCENPEYIKLKVGLKLSTTGY